VTDHVADAGAGLDTLSDDELMAEVFGQMEDLGIRSDDLNQLTAELVEETAEEVEYLSKVAHYFPICMWVAWVCAGETDQRDAIRILGDIITIILGGNRSGKTAGLKALVVVYALGRDHPAVQIWCEVNDYPADQIPVGPGRVWLVAKSSGDSVRIHRPDIDRLLPKGKTHWINRNGKGEGRVFIDVPGYDEPAEIWFKSCDQGRKGMEGDSVRFIGIDEEPEQVGILAELKMRIADQKGRIVIAMTPLMGMTQIYERYVESQEDGSQIHQLDTLNNPYLPDRETFRRLFATMSEDEVAKRRFGLFRANTGMVYPLWTRGTGERFGPGHLCDPFEIPEEWPRFRGVDFGIDHPTVCLWGALGDDHTLYIYREPHRGGLAYRDQADHVRAKEEGGRVLTGWGDSAQKGAMRDFQRAGIPLRRAKKDIKAGISKVEERMSLRADGRPRIKVFRTCANLIREIEGYRWSDNKRESPVGVNDHCMDALRYLCMGLDRYLAVF
jgi:phage terminase large subunit-like protein